MIVTLKLEFDREHLWQWDLKQRLILTGVEEGVEVHFSSPFVRHNEALRRPTYIEDGVMYANIPDSLLQKSGYIRAFIYTSTNTELGEAHTIDSINFKVKERKKPQNYICEEEEILLYNALMERVKNLENKEVDINVLEEADIIPFGEYIVDSVYTPVEINGEIKMPIVGETYTMLAKNMSIGSLSYGKEIVVETVAQSNGDGNSVLEFRNIPYDFHSSNIVFHFYKDNPCTLSTSRGTYLIKLTGKTEAKIITEKSLKDYLPTQENWYICDEIDAQGRPVISEPKEDMYYLVQLTQTVENEVEYDVWSFSSNKWELVDRLTMTYEEDNNEYELQQATENQLGGIKAKNKTNDDTVEAKVGKDGKLYVPTYPKFPSITIDESLNEESKNPVQNKVVTKAFKQLPVVQAPYYATQETGVSGFYLKVDVEELKPLVLYANAEEVEGKTVSCYMTVRCDDGTEKAVTSFGRNTIFYMQRVNNKISLYTVGGNTVYSIDVTDKSNKSKVISQMLWNQNYLGINNSFAYTPTRDYNPATKKYVDDAFNSDLVLNTQPDWEDNDSSTFSHIKNKPFYEVKRKEVLFERKEIVLEIGGIYKFNPSLPLEYGDVCTVIIDTTPLIVEFGKELVLIGTEYQSTIGMLLMLNEEGLTIIQPVNTRFYLEIQTEMMEIKQLEEKYIPNSIARKGDMITVQDILNALPTWQGGAY